MAEPLLELRDVRAGYGEAVVLDGVSLALPADGSLAMLGRNGVGKTTLLLTIMGFVPLARGSIRFRGQDISRPAAAHARARLGLGWVPQERDIFPSLTRRGEPDRRRPARAAGTSHAVYGLFPRLEERRGNMGNQLSGGEQQMLAIARTLMTNPVAAPARRAAGGPRPDHRRGARRRDPPDDREPTASPWSSSSSTPRSRSA